MLLGLLSFLGLLLIGSASLDSLDARLEQTRGFLEDLESRQASSEEILSGIHEHLAVAREYYNELAAREAAITMDIQRIDQRWFLTDSSRAELRNLVEEYILFLYAHRNTVRPSTLFSRGGVSTFLRRMSFMEHLAGDAIERMRFLEQSGDSLSEYRDSLENLVEDVRNLRIQMEAVQERIYREEERQTLLRRNLESQIVAARDSAESLEQRRQQLSSFVTSLESGVSSAPVTQVSGSAYLARNRGSVRWPLRGSIIRSFGADRDPVYGTETISNGVSIAVAESPSNVSSIAPGIVIYANEFMNMGKMVVIDHQDGYYSVYAHLGSLVVGTGNTVETGSLLGRAGALPGGRTGCYLEIRRSGEPVNPMDYLE